MDPLKVTPDNIWNYKQNKPSLIAMDMAEIYAEDTNGARGV